MLYIWLLITFCLTSEYACCKINNVRFIPRCCNIIHKSVIRRIRRVIDRRHTHNERCVCVWHLKCDGLNTTYRSFNDSFLMPTVRLFLVTVCEIFSLFNTRFFICSYSKTRSRFNITGCLIFTYTCTNFVVVCISCNYVANTNNCIVCIRIFYR